MYFSYFTNIEDIDWTSLESLQADGKIKTDGFDAIKLATTFPFNPTANRMIALLMTKEQVYVSRVMRKPTFWFPTWSDANQAVQL